MKKIVSGIIAVSMAAAAALSMAACGDTNGASHTHNYATTWSSDATSHWHACTGEGTCSEPQKDKADHVWNDGVITTPATAAAAGVKTYTCTVCEKTKTESVEYSVDATVTAAQWDDALDLRSVDNMTITITVGDGTLTKKYDGKKWYMSTVNPRRTTEHYYQLSVGQNEYGAYNCTRYDKDGDNWTIFDGGGTPVTVYFDDEGYIAVSTAFTYTNFTYSEADKAYKCASCTESLGSRGEMDYENVVVKFENKKLVYVEFEMEGGKITLTVSDYGSTAVTLPTVA